MVTLTTNLINPIHSGSVTVRGAWQRLSMLLTVMLLSATTALAENVSYKDADGTIKYVDATVLDGSKAILPSGCYVVKGNVSYDYGLSFGGNVQLILADGARTGYTLSGWKLGDQDYDFDTPVIDDITLTATWIPITYIVQFNANGGSGEMESFVATYDQYEDIPSCTFTAPEGKALRGEGWNTAADGSGMMEGATAMTLNTASSGFNTATGELTLYFDDVTAGNTISGGAPFIVKWSKPDGYTADGGFDITNPVFSDITVVPSVTDVTSEDGYVSFVGNFSPVTFTDGSNSVLYLGAGNNVYWPNATMAINANRAYFQLNGITAGTPTANVRSLVLTFGDADTQPAETTAIAHTSAAITDSTGKGRRVVHPRRPQAPGQAHPARHVHQQRAESCGEVRRAAVPRMQSAGKERDGNGQAARNGTPRSRGCNPRAKNGTKDGAKNGAKGKRRTKPDTAGPVA